jgi:hypothetical protein
MKQNYTILVMILATIICCTILTASKSLASNLIEKTYCMSAIGYKHNHDELKDELLMKVQEMALHELFGQMISSYKIVDNGLLTKEQIMSISSGYIKIKGNPIFKSGSNFGEVCVTINAYITEEQKKKVMPLKIIHKSCLSKPDIPVGKLIKKAEDKVIIDALINYERKLKDINSNILLNLVREVKYIEDETGLIDNSGTYCVKFSGYIYPLEIMQVIQNNTMYKEDTLKNFIDREESLKENIKDNSAENANSEGSCDIKHAQKVLKELYLYNRKISGILCDETKTALKNFQLINGFEPTGFLDQKTCELLNSKKVK